MLLPIGATARRPAFSAIIKMSLIRKIFRIVVPASLRDSARKAYLGWIFRRAMRNFMREPEAHALAGDPVLRDLIRGWGNEDWSALDEYLAACISEVSVSQGPVLECGSGLSTLLAGAVAKKRGLRYTALEHNAEWAERVRQALQQYDINGVELLLRPLADRGEFDWYDVDPNELLEPALVICDGPPGSTRGGRYGLCPVLGDHIKDGCVILLDDAGRTQEIEIARQWQKELNASVETSGTEKPYIRILIGDRQAAIPVALPAAAQL